jgi:hypothetical protein
MPLAWKASRLTQIKSSVGMSAHLRESGQTQEKWDNNNTNINSHNDCYDNINYDFLNSHLCENTPYFVRQYYTLKASNPTGIGDDLPRGKSAGREADTSIYSRGQEWWSYTATPSYIFMAWYLIN